MRKLYIFIIAAIAVLACSEDNEIANKPQERIDFNMLVGEWVSADSEKNYYTELILSNNFWAQYTIVQNEVGSNSIYDTDKGVWNWYDDNQMISIITGMHKIPYQKVVEITNTRMQLRHTSYNTVETYYQLVETLEIDAGNSTSIKYLQEHGDFALKQATSSNEEVATVSADGIVEAHQGGIAYISLESEQEIVYIKVVVKGRVNRFIDETHLTIDEIEKIHGKPDVAATRIDSINGFEGGYVYYQFDNDKHLNAIQYTYDVYSREIKNILTRYSSESPLNQDVAYTYKYYVQTGDDNNNFGLSSTFLDNSYIITIFEKDAMIKYTNLDCNSYHVSNRPKKYLHELMNYTIDHILEKYGTPDNSVNTDTQTSYAYMISQLRAPGKEGHIADDKLAYIDYLYDAETREIIEIRTVYLEEAYCMADLDYIINNNYQLSKSAEYGPYPDYRDCDFYYKYNGYVNFGEGLDFCYITYNNLAYYLRKAAE